MANPEHVARLKEGAKSWNEWRARTNEKPDFSAVKLWHDSLSHYNLQLSDFSDAELLGTGFRHARCDDCSFERARIDDCVFFATTLRNCTFRNAAILSSTFSWCSLDQSDFSKAVVGGNTFAHLSLQSVRGLDDLEGTFKNSIGIDTFFESGGLPESFLRGSGVPDEFIQYASSLVGTAIDYYSCFLSYSSRDDEFARRLFNDLQGKNVRTWFAPEELKIGDRFRSRIDESIRSHDKLVIILSANSVNSDWVETEVESAIEREQKEGKDVLFPIAIDEEGFTSNQPWAADIRRKRHIGDFRKWKSHDDYTAAFDRLVRDLKKSQPPIIMKGG
jgi:hypothetical protein